MAKQASKPKKRTNEEKAAADAKAKDRSTMYVTEKGQRVTVTTCGCGGKGCASCGGLGFTKQPHFLNL